MLKRGISLFLSTVILISATGCWDQIEIEERGFVVGTAIDIGEEKEADEAGGLTASKRPEDQKPLMITIQMLSLSGSSSKKQGGSSGAEGEFFNVSSIGETIFQAIRELAERSSRTPYFGHNQILIFSEEVASSKLFGGALDVFLRDHEIKRSLNVYISEGEARSILDIQPDDNQIPAQYIESVAGNNYKTSRMLQDVRLGDVHQYLLGKVSFALPRIVASENEVMLNGSAVFSGKENKMVGFLDEDETKGLNFVLGQVQGGFLTAKYKDNLLSYEMINASRSISADVSNPDKIKFHIHIESNGGLAEKFTQLNLLSEDVIRTIEKLFAEEIQRLVNDAVQALQKDLKTDVLGLIDLLRQNHHNVWKQIKDDWDGGRQLFSECDIHVTAETKILRRGTINRSH